MPLCIKAIDRQTLGCWAILILVMLFPFGSYAKQANKYSPLSHYFMDGKMVGTWKWVVGNKFNYYLPVNGVEGQTVDSKLSVTSAKYQEKDTAIRATWVGSLDRSSLYLQGFGTINLNSVKDKVAISAEYMIESRESEVRMAFLQDCNFPCRAEMDISKYFKSKPLNQWFTFPIPLNCFTKSGLDAKNIVSPFMLSTNSKITLRIANVRLILLPEGEKGCI